MRHEDAHDLLHKDPAKDYKDDGLPFCKKCGEKFLGYPQDKLCFFCEKERIQMAKWKNNMIKSTLAK